jgi:mRNA-degrading endonuclease HigB of HigAB toxin-antitoxin module
MRVRLVGQLEIADFIRGRPEEAEVLGAWLNEVRHRRWANSEALMADFPSEARRAPQVVFRLGPTPVFVEAIVDYRNAVVVVTGVSVSDSDT